jgi:hypothetical protein
MSNSDKYKMNQMCKRIDELNAVDRTPEQETELQQLLEAKDDLDFECCCDLKDRLDVIGDC